MKISLINRSYKLKNNFSRSYIKSYAEDNQYAYNC